MASGSTTRHRLSRDEFQKVNNSISINIIAKIKIPQCIGQKKQLKSLGVYSNKMFFHQKSEIRPTAQRSLTSGHF